MRPYLPPLIRSLAAPAGRLLPAQSHGVRGPELYVDTEGMNDRGNPYAYGGFAVAGSPPGQWPRYNAAAGQMYGAIPDQHDADVTGAARGPRLAIGTGYVTPSHLWNLAGIAGGWSRPYAPNQGAHPRQPTARLAFGRLGLMAGGALGVRPPLPTLPEAQRMVQPQL